MRRRKPLPGITTWAANDRNPASDSRSEYGVELLASIAATASCARCSLAGCKSPSIARVSSSMSRKSAVVPAALFLLLAVRPKSWYSQSKS